MKDRNSIQSTEYLSLQYYNLGGALGVMVMVVANGHGDLSSNPGRVC